MHAQWPYLTSPHAHRRVVDYSTVHESSVRADLAEGLGSPRLALSNEGTPRVSNLSRRLILPIGMQSVVVDSLRWLHARESEVPGNFDSADILVTMNARDAKFDESRRVSR